MDKFYRLDSQHSLEEMLEKTFARHPEFKNSQLQVEIKGEELHLSGTVKNYYCKQLAQESIRSIIGERTIHNEIKVVIR